MRKPCKCGSWAINDGSYGRDPGVDLHLCDVCYWRTRAQPAEEVQQVATKAATVHKRIDSLCTAANTPGGDYFDASTNLMLAVRELLVRLGHPHAFDGRIMTPTTAIQRAEQWRKEGACGEAAKVAIALLNELERVQALHRLMPYVQAANEFAHEREKTDSEWFAEWLQTALKDKS